MAYNAHQIVTMTITPLMSANNLPLLLIFCMVFHDNKINDHQATIHRNNATMLRTMMMLINTSCVTTLKEQRLASFCVFNLQPPSITTYNFKIVNQQTTAIKSYPQLL